MAAPSRTPEQVLDELRFRTAEIQQGLSVLRDLADWVSFRVIQADRLLTELSDESPPHEPQFPHLPPAQTA